MSQIWFALAASLTVFMTSFNGVHAQSITDVERLFSNLMVGYSKMFRPVLNQSKQVIVVPGLDIVSIQDFNEVEEKISFTALLYLAWNDERLVWDPKDYGGIDNLYIDVSKIWAPQLMLTNVVNKNERLSEDWHTVRVNASGWCLYIIANVFTSSCDVDVTFYPWDTQTCSLDFMPANYGVDKMILYPIYHKVELTYYSPNGAWDLMDTSVTSELYSFMVRFNVVLERKPRFAIVNVILPLIIMSALNILVFLIPTECGERISFCLTVLLSIAVFLTLVGDNLPKNSNPMSLFSYYLVSVLAISAAITLSVICSLHMYHRSEKQQPGGAWRAIAMCLGCYCVRRTRSESADRTNRSDEIKFARPENASHRSSHGMHSIPYSNHTNRGVILYRPTHSYGTLPSDRPEDKRLHKQEKDDSDSSVLEITWADVSVALDKVFFLFFILLLITDTLCFLIIIYHNVSL
ncbi:hypothetical protein DPMN_093509 [Dreissena polymorpha]|uniref:Uncharacterized protein n=1 Tax=Dreissena polymorpha TaxID=45954 RepID=A0A9D4L329_DREPO|nr:hypothetical protein DPMN_093509 [Dreissena polymorpha]